MYMWQKNKKDTAISQIKKKILCLKNIYTSLKIT